MWSYYGSKANLVDFYPAPKEDLIIEPFAGSARYSLKHFDRNVTLVDKYKVIIDIWKWLQLCSPKDILTLPKLKNKESLNDFNFDCEEAKLFMGFVIAFGMATPTLKATKHNDYRPNFINYTLQKVSKSLFKIKHWNLIHGSYEDLENKRATWFVDPPYQNGGHCYVENNKNINFNGLSIWCKERIGQVIVCEEMKADWLPFNPLIDNKSGRGKNRLEAIWTNEMTIYNNIQQSLF